MFTCQVESVRVEVCFCVIFLSFTDHISTYVHMSLRFRFPGVFKFLHISFFVNLSLLCHAMSLLFNRMVIVLSRPHVKQALIDDLFQWVHMF